MHWVRSLYSRARRPRPPRSFFLCDPDTNTMAVSSLAMGRRVGYNPFAAILLFTSLFHVAEPKLEKMPSWSVSRVPDYRDLSLLCTVLHIVHVHVVITEI